MKYRCENFGGIIASDDPPFLAMVDRTFMKELGVSESARWDVEDESIGRLSAPTEVHLAATMICPAKCEHCYMDAGDAPPEEMDTDTFKRALKTLADFGVFHVALGGGEALARPDIFELADYAREVGLVPNLTISGAYLSEEIAERMASTFGQVNVSMDGVGEYFSTFRVGADYSVADRALELLTSAGVSTGINCVLGRENYPGLDELFAYAAKRKLSEVELLRFKPSGRGKARFMEQRMNYDQNIDLIPKLAELSKQYDLMAKIDCSFVPMLCEHNPSLEQMEKLATYGCEAGNVLVGIGSDGLVSGCSFLKKTDCSVFDLPAAWADKKLFDVFTSWEKQAREPCASCEYLTLCKGGCHAVAEFVTGSISDPDPDCPRVVRATQEAGACV